MRRWVVRTATFAAILVATLLSAYACRRAVAAVLIERYLATFGVTSKIEVTRLDPHVVVANVRLGPAASPDASGIIDASLAWAGLSPAIRSLHLTSARVQAHFDGRHLSLGAEDKLLEFVLNRPRQGTPPDVAVDGARVLIDSPQGRLELMADAALRAGVLQTLQAKLLPGEFRGANLVIGLQGGTVRVNSNRDGLDVQAEVTGHVSGNAHGTTGHLGRLKLHLEGSSLELSTVGGFNATGHLKVRVEAENVELGRAAAGRVVAVVDAPDSHLSSSKSNIGTDIRADSYAEGVSFPLNGGTAVIRRAEARIHAGLKSGASGLEMNGRADLSLAGEVSDGVARRLARQVPLLGSDPNSRSILITALRSMVATADGIRATYSAGRIGLSLEKPASLSGGNGVRVTLEPQALADLLDTDTASGEYRGAFKLTVDGGGGPSLTSSPPSMEEIPTVSEIEGISAHLGGFLFRRGCPGEKAWFSPRSTPTEGSLTRVVPQPQTPPGLTTSPQTSLPACPAVGLSAMRILTDGCGGFEPVCRRAILPRPGVRGLPRTLVSVVVPSYSLGLGRDRSLVMSAQWNVAARLSAAPLRRLAFTAAGTLRAATGTYTVFIRDCAHISLGELASGHVDLVDMKAQLCHARAPWLVVDGRRWAVHSMWRALSAHLPAANTSIADGTGRMDLSGDTSGMSGGELKLTSLQLNDAAPATRFAPVSVQGNFALKDRVWTGALDVGLVRGSHPLGRVGLRHSVSTGSGEARIEMPGLEFSAGGLQPSMLSPWLQSLARAHGRTGFDGTFSWASGRLSSRGMLRLENWGFSSAAGDVSQVNANVELTSLLPLQSAPRQFVAAGKIDAVLPLTEVSGHFELLPTALNVEDTRMNFADGAIMLGPATLPFDAKAKMSATVRLQDVDLNKVVATTSLGDRLKLDVRVSGTIPFSKSATGLEVTHGSFSSTGPGRIEISRRIWSADAEKEGGAIRDFAYQALEHLAVDELDGTINSLPEGRLGVVLHVRGRHDPAVAAPTRIGILAFLRGHAFDKPVPLPKGTPIDLTLDSSLNFEGLLDTWRAASSAVHP